MNKVTFIDRDGHTVSMTKEEIAESLRKMGNPTGIYLLLGRKDGFVKGVLHLDDYKTYRNIWNPVEQFRASTMPHYRFYQIWHKKFRWWLKQRAARRQFDSVNDKGLIWKPTPFVLEIPWLRLKGKKAITIQVV